MKKRPKRTVGIPIVELIVICLGKVEGCIGNVATIENINVGWFSGNQVPTPTAPNATMLFQRIEHSNR